MLNHIHRHFNRGSEARAEKVSSGSMQGWASIYDRIVAVYSLGQERKFRQATLALAKIRPGERVLEVGCGTGTLALAAKQQEPSAQVSGIDVASDMLAAAREKASRAGLPVTFQPGRIEAIPYPDAQFDLVLSSLMLHHIPGEAAKQQGLGEVLRVLKPGGRVLVVDVARSRSRLVLWAQEKIFGKSMMAHSLDEFIPLLEQAGFVEIQSGPTQSSFLDYLSGRKP